MHCVSSVWVMYMKYGDIILCCNSVFVHSDLIIVLSCSIDATTSDCMARFANDAPHHEANSVMKKVLNTFSTHLCLFALCDLDEGEEIRYDYGVGQELYWRNVSKAAMEMFS